MCLVAYDKSDVFQMPIRQVTDGDCFSLANMTIGLQSECTHAACYRFLLCLECVQYLPPSSPHQKMIYVFENICRQYLQMIFVCHAAHSALFRQSHLRKAYSLIVQFCLVKSMID